MVSYGMYDNDEISWCLWGEEDIVANGNQDVMVGETVNRNQLYLKLHKKRISTAMIKEQNCGNNRNMLNVQKFMFSHQTLGNLQQILKYCPILYV